ncbi:tyrosine-protein phosphatase non-receptor type 13-like [Pseudoliparis swirei]|uniref:tyrosine-protein phosphatase non-receptor type 13-like n=1 Tax=Pseudoliparis swirei TaxID=2059687 RepID=UPI0024BDE6AB|nr:tyrosine-protein phosphatase non-receptor type 13-like [Pseudoliparis swirei]
MTGVSHTKAVTTIRKAKGPVHLIVSRPPDQNPNTYMAYLPINSDKCNGNTDVSEDSGAKTLFPLRNELKPGSCPVLPPIDYEEDPLGHKRETQHSAELSEDTDCDGSSLPEDSPESSREVEVEDDPRNENYLQMSVGQQEEDEITWGSDELPIENMNSESRDDEPIITEDELTSLPLIKVVPDGQYTGPHLNTVVRMMRGLLEQKVPLQEFDNLQNLQPLDDCLIGHTKENKKKNRYKNIVPFDTTRVVLGRDGGYINANFINMSVKEENYMYIACQGPLPTTLGDFWQMVWEQKSNVIAMMTQEVEGGKVKCQRYWPDTPRTAEMVDDRLQITLIKDQYLDNFVIRLIEVKDVQTNEIQHVTHLNYTGWPDHGTPEQPEQLLTFISYMRHVHRSGPIVSHCSAGIGRSGTLICIDVVLGLISKDADFDLSDVVRNMRLQRQRMIQTEEQYVFYYQVILYVLRCLQAEENISG